LLTGTILIASSMSSEYRPIEQSKTYFPFPIKGPVEQATDAVFQSVIYKRKTYPIYAVFQESPQFREGSKIVPTKTSPPWILGIQSVVM
jgi:hypothetical protein